MLKDVQNEAAQVAAQWKRAATLGMAGKLPAEEWEVIEAPNFEARAYVYLYEQFLTDDAARRRFLTCIEYARHELAEGLLKDDEKERQIYLAIIKESAAGLELLFCE